MMEITTVKPLPTSFPNTTSVPADHIRHSLRAIKLVFMCVISLVGITGNVIICKKMLRTKRKSSEYFIINLALADLTVCAMGIPLDIYDELHDTWEFGSFLCKVIWPYQTLLVLVSIMTLTAMSLERYRVIMTPFKPRLKKSDLLKVIACVWVIGLCVIAPYVNYLTYKDKQCKENWPMETSGAYYSLSLFVIDYCIPLTIITYCYTRAGFKLHENSKQMKRLNTSSQIANRAQRKRLRDNARVIKRFSFAVLMFLVCMLPGDCFWMWKSFGNASFEYENHFQTFANILLYANSAINPFIFGACQVGCLGTADRKARRPGLRRVLSLQSECTSQMAANNNNNAKTLDYDKEIINFSKINHMRETNV